MSETKWTRCDKPWSLSLTDKGFGVGVDDSFADGHNWMAIADVRQHSLIGHSEARANAQLIAAAPDMAEALEKLLNHYTRLVESGDAGFWDAEKEDEVIAARAALAKAKGEA